MSFESYLLALLEIFRSNKGDAQNFLESQNFYREERLGIFPSLRSYIAGQSLFKFHGPYTGGSSESWYFSWLLPHTTPLSKKFVSCPTTHYLLTSQNGTCKISPYYPGVNQRSITTPTLDMLTLVIILILYLELLLPYCSFGLDKICGKYKGIWGNMKEYVENIKE